MKNKISFFCLLFCLWQGPLSIEAQSLGNADASRGNSFNQTLKENEHPKLAVNLREGSLILQAEVLYNAQPSSYLAIFSVTQTSENMEDVDKYMNQRLDNFKKAVLNLGIADNQIFTDFVTLVPKFEVQLEKRRRSKTANEVPIGFELKKNIHVGFTDTKLLDRLITAAAANEIYDLARVEVNVKDVKKIHAELRAEALKIIDAKATPYASLGLKLYPLSMGDNFETYFPSENYESYVAYATDYSQLSSNQNFSQGKLGIKSAQKGKTVFYSRLPYDQFDSVINPEFVEPPIQIHYKVMVSYSVENIELAKKRDIDTEKHKQQSEIARKDEVEIRKIQAANPPKQK
jgi:uncharacterized protein YggE